MIVEWLKQHWFIFTALIAVGTAWGQTTSKVSELEKKLDEKAKKEQKIDDVVEKSGRLDERTLNIQKDVQEQRALLIQIIQNQNRMIKQVEKK